MSKFTKEMVDDYADKLLIGLTEEENKMVLDEFDIIDADLDKVTKIANIEEVEPMTHCLDDFEYVLRDDVVVESVPIEDLLRNADETDGDEVQVPKVVGQVIMMKYMNKSITELHDMLKKGEVTSDELVKESLE